MAQKVKAIASNTRDYRETLLSAVDEYLARLVNHAKKRVDTICRLMSLRAEHLEADEYIKLESETMLDLLSGPYRMPVLRASLEIVDHDPMLVLTFENSFSAVGFSTMLLTVAENFRG